MLCFHWVWAQSTWPLILDAKSDLDLSTSIIPLCVMYCRHRVSPIGERKKIELTFDLRWPLPLTFIRFILNLSPVVLHSPSFETNQSKVKFNETFNLRIRWPRLISFLVPVLILSLLCFWLPCIYYCFRRLWTRINITSTKSWLFLTPLYLLLLPPTLNPN